MSSKKGAIRKTKLLAKLVDKEKGPCAICQHDVDDEIIYGKLYVIGDIKCHYFCVLLSCCLIQKGKDEEGLYGFLYPDILAEIERSKKHRCSYCSRGGATLGCCVSHCRKQFHLPCGRSRNAVSLFYGSYKSYCQDHAPKQCVADNIMAKAKLRLERDRKKRKSTVTDLEESKNDVNENEETVCVICYEKVAGYPSPQTFWPPCCARDAWFHRTCLQRMALSAGLHYLRCPLCNDTARFHAAVVAHGYYVPDRDAAWEIEGGAFADMYERQVACDADLCACPQGRAYDGDGPWDIVVCMLCGSSGVHPQCRASGSGPVPQRHVCRVCRPAAPEDLEGLAVTIEAVILSERAPRRTARRPLMRSRMSLRSTKQRNQGMSSCSSQDNINIKIEQYDKDSTTKYNTESSRQLLNLKSPKRPLLEATVHKHIELQSPGKLLVCSLRDVTHTEVNVDPKLLEQVRAKFRKPKPLSEKKRIVTDIIESLINNSAKEASKTKEAVKEWCSPKKLVDIKREEMEEQENVAPESNTPMKIDYEFTTPKKLTPTPVTIDEDTQDCMVITPVKTLSIDVDESSNSTFQLAPEFLAEHISDDSFPPCETPKLKTVDIQKDSSLEISENNEIVNVSVVKMEECNNYDIFKELNLKSPEKIKKCAFKFSPIDKETLQNNNLNIAMESFKNHYLNEVGRDVNFKFNFKFNNHTKQIYSGDIINRNHDPIDNGNTINHDYTKMVEDNNFNSNKKVKVDSNHLDKPNSRDLKEIDRHVHKFEHITTETINNGNIFNSNQSELIEDDSNLKKRRNRSLRRKLNHNQSKQVDDCNNSDYNDTKTVDNDNNLRDTRCEFNHNHAKRIDNVKKLRTPIDFAIEADRKRKHTDSLRSGKRKKLTKKKFVECNVKCKDKEAEIELSNDNSNLKLSLVAERRKKKKKKSTKLSIKDKNIKVKIKWREERLKLKITDSKKELSPKNLKQYVLNYGDGKATDVLEKPNHEVAPIKRKYIKLEKSPDHMKQTNIQNFFITLKNERAE